MPIRLPANAPAIEPFSFAVASDPHVGTAAGAENLEQLAEETKRLGVAFTILCGDLTETGSPEEVDEFVRIAAKFEGKLHAAAGNHDSRWGPGGKAHYPKLLGREGPYTSFDHGGLQFVILDSSIVGAAQGGIDRTQVEWLRDQPLGTAAPVVVALHHPPEGLAGWDLRNILPNLPISLLLCGHGHAMRTNPFGEIGQSRMTANLYGEGRYRVVHVRPDRFVFENRVLGSEDSEPDGELLLRPLRVWTQICDFSAPPFEWVGESRASSLQSVAVADGRILAAGIEGVLASHDAESGALLYSIPLEGPCYGSPVVADDHVVVADESGTVTAFDLKDLSTVWKSKFDGGFAMTPATDGTKVYAGSGDGILHALSLEDGREIWSFRGERHFGPPAVGESAVFAGNWDGHVYALDREKGSLLWKRKVHDSFYFAPGTTRPAIAGDLVVVTFAVPTRPPDAPSVLALCAMDGEIVWGLRKSAGYASPLVLGDRVILATTDGRVLAVEARTGRVIWDEPTGGPVFDAGPSPCEGGFVLGTVDGEIVFFEAETGAYRGRGPDLETLLLASPVAAGNRVVVPITFERKICAFPIP